MVIDEINVESVFTFEPKDDSPIRANSHGMEAFQLPLEGMEAKSRHVHAIKILCGVQDRENEADPCQHVRW